MKIVIALLCLMPAIAAADALIAGAPVHAVSRGTAIIDSRLDEYTGQSAIDIGGAGARASLRLLYDDRALYIGADIADAQINVAGASPADPLYRDDSLELLLAAGAKALVTATGLKLAGLAFESSVTLSDTGYTLEIAIPWAALQIAAPPAQLPFDINLNDRDAQGTRAMHTWANIDRGGINNPQGYGLLLLTREAQPPPDDLVTPRPQADPIGALQWAAVAGAQGYRLYWGPQAGEYNRSIETTGTDIDLIDAGITKAGVYHIAVAAYNAAGESDKSAPITFVLTTDCPIAGPPAPRPWVVAANGKQPDRPLYAINAKGDRQAVGRVAVGRACEAKTISPIYRSDNEYRYVTNADGTRGLAVCSPRGSL